MELQELVKLAGECKGSGNWTSASLIRVGGILASKINAIQNLSGPEKLKLVQRVLIQVLAEAENKECADSKLSEDEVKAIHDRYDILENTVGETLPASLELAINASRGRLDLKKIKPSVWVKMCSCFATTVVHELASLHLISEAHATQARRAIETVKAKASDYAEQKEAESSSKVEPQEEKKEAVVSAPESVPATEEKSQ